MSERENTSLSVALESESLEALYAAWLEFRLQRLTAQAARAREREALETRAEYLLKAVEAARKLPGDSKKSKSKAKTKSKALAKNDPLAEFHDKAQGEVSAAQKALCDREKREESEADAVDARVRKALLHRADQHLAIHKPFVRVQVHPVGKTQAILEVAAPGEEDAVLLLRLLHGKLPTRWGYFADDAVEDLARGPAHFYADEGVAELFPPDADAEDEILHAKSHFVPARMQLPFVIPNSKWPRFRLVHHGPIAQVEARRKGEPYAHVLHRGDSELLSGYLLRLKLEGRIELDLNVG